WQLLSLLLPPVAELLQGRRRPKCNREEFLCAVHQWDQQHIAPPNGLKWQTVSVRIFSGALFVRRNRPDRLCRFPCDRPRCKVQVRRSQTIWLSGTFFQWEGRPIVR